MHQNELSLLKAVKNDISLQVYLDKNGYAKGSLYLDDGESYYKTKDDYISLEYIYKNDSLMVYKQEEKSFYLQGKDKFVKQVQIVGLNGRNMPESVINTISGKELDFHFDDALNALIVSDVDLPI